MAIGDSLTYGYRKAFWGISRLFCFGYLRPKFHIQVAQPDLRLPKPPYIMVSNHGTFFDPWIVGHLTADPLAIMMNEEGFKTSRFSQWYLRNIGAYPKKKGESDIRAMKLTMNALDAGYAILIFPEGQTTWDGETQPIYRGVESIAKRAKVPLVMNRVIGNFMSKPWWADTYRRGRVLLERQVVPVEEVEAASKAELRQRIVEFLYNNDIKNPRNKEVRFEGPPATAGLTRFVWACPSCAAEGGLRTESDTLRCDACGAAWTMDPAFGFTPVGNAPDVGDLHDLARWHKDFVQQRIAGSDAVLACDEGVHLCDVTDLGEYVVRATGTLELTREHLRFAGADNEITLPLDAVHDYVFQHKNIFECRADGQVYKFRFDAGSCMKWVFYLRYLNDYAQAEERGYY